MKNVKKQKQQSQKKLTLKKETIRDLSAKDLMNHEGASGAHQGQLTWRRLKDVALTDVRI